MTRPEGLFAVDDHGLAFADSKYVLVVKDNEPSEIKPYDLFDAARFDELYAVSYVSSPRAFGRIAERFRYVEFILGTPDSDLQAGLESFINLANPEEAIGFLNWLSASFTENAFSNKPPIRGNRRI